VVTLGIALLCDIFCLPALVAVFDRPPRAADPGPAGSVTDRAG